MRKVLYNKRRKWYHVCMSHFKGRSSRDTEHWMGHATTWSEHPGEAQTQLCRGYCLQSTKTAWKPLVPPTCHLQGKFQQPQYRTRTSESIISSVSCSILHLNQRYPYPSHYIQSTYFQYQSNPCVLNRDICGFGQTYYSMANSVELETLL